MNLTVVSEIEDVSHPIMLDLFVFAIFSHFTYTYGIEPSLNRLLFP